MNERSHTRFAAKYSPTKLMEMIVSKGVAACRWNSESLLTDILANNGGDDGTRTRGLCRDRAAF